ncbi:MAG TPA: hypothetical protein PK771_14610 [Spirochaetota bacterium]|nr:hypothetical protein [Spirochaetota bacterium]
MNRFFNNDKVKIEINKVLFDTLTESARLHEMSINDYINYLVYKENFLHLSTHSLQREEKFEKYYEKYCEEKSEKDVWSTLFNI